MSDAFNPSTVPIQPASEAIEDRYHGESQRRAKKRQEAAKPKPVEEIEAEEPEDGQQKHQLDLDA